MIKVSIVGASGYAGGELLRILLQHPKVSIGQVTSQRFVDQSVILTHPNLRGQTSLSYSSIDELTECDVLFVALPNGQSHLRLRTLKKLAGKIIDLGDDLRLSDQSVYGLAELHREEIKTAKLVSGAGCEATAIILGLYPLVKEGLIADESITADVKIGSSAAGNKSTSSSHHPERHNVLRSYKPTNHRHEKEILQNLSINVEMSATAVNLVRGILATIQVRLKNKLTEKQVFKAYRKVYQDEPFIRLVKQRQGLYRYPEPKLLWGTNYCDIGFEKAEDSNRLVVISAIDNLVKGTAGQAVQAMNLMMGFEETLGLTFSGLHPV